MAGMATTVRIAPGHTVQAVSTCSYGAVAESSAQNASSSSPANAPGGSPQKHLPMVAGAFRPSPIGMDRLQRAPHRPPDLRPVSAQTQVLVSSLLGLLVGVPT